MIPFDPLYYPYPSQRTAVYASRGMVATAQPLAAEAGLEILKRGGNAIDAAIAAAAVLTVVEPNSNSIGGDSFALVWRKGQLYGLNSSGPAPKSISIDAIKRAGFDKIPTYGMLPVTVPGTPASWAELSSRFGTLPLTETLRPAISYAEKGFPVSPIVGRNWQIGYRHLLACKGPEFQAWFDTFAPNGKPPEIGEIWRSQNHADTLRSIAETNAESFYKGHLAEQIDACFRQFGGYLTKEDLADFKPVWVDPIKVNYRGYEVWEIPPNGQGLVALIALQMLKGFDFAAKDTVDTYHKQIEAVKLAFADGLKYITDPNKMQVSVDDLLSEKYADQRRSLISNQALLPEAGQPRISDTIYLAAADDEGNMVSFIQSHSGDFGCGVVVPGTGICMQNRGAGFSLDPSHHNVLEPGKKTYHTIIPGFLTKGDQPIGAFGIMGGMNQPQAHVQFVMNLLDFHLNPQAALDAPRWRWTEGRTVHVEPQFPDHIAQALARKGHLIQRTLDSGMFGRGQVILRDPATKSLIGATEPRADGQVAAW